MNTGSVETKCVSKVQAPESEPKRRFGHLCFGNTRVTICRYSFNSSYTTTRMKIRKLVLFWGENSLRVFDWDCEHC